MVVGSVRGMAVPENAKNKDAAKEFVKFIVSKHAQQISLNNMGGVVSGDLDTAAVTPASSRSSRAMPSYRPTTS